MSILLLTLAPAIAGLAALAIKHRRVNLALLLGSCALHLTIALGLWLMPAPSLGDWFVLDLPGHLFLTLTSLLFAAVSVYVVSWLPGEEQGGHVSSRFFVPCLLWFLSAMTLVTVTQHLAVMWAAIEATTLASAPLIYFHRKREALEATWKYLLICSVGIALALLGTFFLGIAATGPANGSTALVLSELMEVAPAMHPAWLKAAFIMALVGYGTKMGLVPMHTWLPDAHSQSPSLVSALLSGALLNCAFLAILRFYQVCVASGDAAFARTLLCVFGFGSIAVAVALMVGQRDYKRLLAYSSVENMGVLAVGVGLGGAATFGAMLHAVNHSLCKAALFLLAGNVLRIYGTTTAGEVRAVLQRLPVSGVLLTGAFLAIGGVPPFGPFMSELVIFQTAIRGPQAVLGVLFIALLALGFLGMSGVVFPMLQGHAYDGLLQVKPEPVLSVLPSLLLLAGVVVLGIYLPAGMGDVLHRTAAMIGGIHG